jgi:hypothetical protein
MSAWKKIPWVNKHPRAAVGILVAALAVAGLGLLPGGDASTADAMDQVFFKVQRGPLTISINEGGTIVSRERHTVATDLSDDTTILWLIDEGAEVTKGQ